MFCPACRYAGPPPDAVRAELGAAAAILSATAMAHRQLTWAQRRLGLGAAASSRAVSNLLVLLALPFAACGGCFTLVGMDQDSFDVATFVFAWGPLLFIVLTGGLVLRSYGKQRGRAERDLAAVPPAVPGQPFGCHVCGGDLQAFDASRAAVLRCRYCAADNIVRADLLAHAASFAHAAASTIREQVERHAQDLVRHQRGAKQSLVLVTVLSPVSIFVVLVVFAMAESRGRVEDEYALVDTDKGPCVAARLTYVKTAKGEAELGLTDRNGHAVLRKRVKIADSAFFKGDALVGREVRFRDGDETLHGKVEAATRGALLKTEEVSVDVGAKRPKNVEIKGLCFDTAPADLVLVPFEASK